MAPGLTKTQAGFSDGRSFALLAAGAAALAAGLALAGLAPQAGLAAAAAAALSVFAALRATDLRPPTAEAVGLEPEAAAVSMLAELAPLLEALPDPALLVGRDGRIAGSNAAARTQLKFEAQGLVLSSILRQPDVLDAAQAAAVDGSSRTVEYQTAAMVDEHFKVYVAPLSWEAETAALMVFHDQTALIATERMRADFLANASHELKTPLAGLSAVIDTLAGHAKNDPEAQAQFIEIMRRQATRMQRLIEDLLSLSKIELNEHVPPVGRADMLHVAREAIDALLPVAAERQIDLHLVEEGAPGPVLGERFQLAQVAQNLIDNAIKYSPAGASVRVILGVARGREAAADAAGRRWPEADRISLLTPPPGPERAFAYLRVEDSGCGIARRHLPRLSERFFRVDRDDNPVRSGTGLGLAIVKHIISRHRGGVVVESIPERGSAFAMLVAEAPPQALPRPAATGAALAQALQPSQPLQQERSS